MIVVAVSLTLEIMAQSPVPVSFVVVPLLTVVAVTALTALLIEKIRPLVRKLTITTLGAWVIVFVAGWCWYFAMDDGLHAFIGEDLTAATATLDQRICRSMNSDLPTSTRIVKGSDHEFQIVCYTWWGLKTPNAVVRNRY